MPSFNIFTIITAAGLFVEFTTAIPHIRGPVKVSPIESWGKPSPKVADIVPSTVSIIECNSKVPFNARGGTMSLQHHYVTSNVDKCSQLTSEFIEFPVGDYKCARDRKDKMTVKCQKGSDKVTMRCKSVTPKEVPGTFTCNKRENCKVVTECFAEKETVDEVDY